MSQHLLVVDDDEAVLQSCETILEDGGHRVTLASTPEAALDLIHHTSFDLVLLDFKLPRMNGLEVLERACKIDPDLVVIMFTGYGTFESAVQAVKKGAFNYITKPFTAAQLLSEIEKGLEHRRRLRGDTPALQRLAQCCPLHQIVGRSEALQKALATVAKVAPCDADVLVTGRSGTGKELIARAIHANSKRRDKPFVPVDCAALPSNLLESELFGHEKGAFTGATSLRKGRFELASDGTIFLDEIGDLPIGLQPKILRVLQEKEFERVGGEKTIKVDVRLIAATSRKLEELVSGGQFREDLYYRLNVVPVFLPPLRARRVDIPPLVDYFLKKYNDENEKTVRLTPEALNAFLDYEWPGNVRELENTIERLVVMSSGKVITLANIPLNIREQAVRARHSLRFKDALPSTIAEIEKATILDALEKTGGIQAKAARLLGLTPRQIGYKMKRYGIEAK